jgi:hypothetical protein
MCAGCHENRTETVVLQPGIIGTRPQTPLGRAAVGRGMVWSSDGLLRVMTNLPIADEGLKQAHRVDNEALRHAIILFLSKSTE